MARSTKKESVEKEATAPTDSPTQNCSLSKEPQPKVIEVGDVPTASTEKAPAPVVTKGDDGVINIA